MVFALVLGTLGARWTLSAHEANNRADAIGTQLREFETRIATLNEKATMPDRFNEALQFIERAGSLQHGIDPVAGMGLVREAAAGQVRILRVRMEEPMPAGAPARTPGAPAVAEPTLRVDAVVDAAHGDPGMQIPTFVERLRQAGFDPIPLDPQAGAAASRSAGGFFSYLLKRPAAAPAVAVATGATP